MIYFPTCQICSNLKNCMSSYDGRADCFMVYVRLLGRFSSRGQQTSQRNKRVEDSLVPLFESS